MLKVFAHDPQGQSALQCVLQTPSLYDEFLRYLARWGHSVPAANLQRDWSLPHVQMPRCCRYSSAFTEIPIVTGAVSVVRGSGGSGKPVSALAFPPHAHGQRIIGFKPGTGGSSGVSFLKRALELTFFPELFEVRTSIGADRGSPG